jgi:hypothetical protein
MQYLPYIIILTAWTIVYAAYLIPAGSPFPEGEHLLGEAAILTYLTIPFTQVLSWLLGSMVLVGLTWVATRTFRRIRFE